MTDKSLRICLIQHSTRSDNLGVGALTVAQIEILERIAADLGRGLDLTIMDAKAPRAPYVGGDNIRIVDIERKVLMSPGGFFKIAREAHAVIDIGAGDSFTDIYGTARLKRMFAMKAMVHAARTPLIMGPQTIGPFTKGWSKRLARLTMARSALVATRDRLSTDHAHELGFPGVIEASDLALRLPYEAPAPRDPSAPPRVGINVSGLLMNRGYTGGNEFGIKADYPALIRSLIRFFQGEGAEVHLVGHVTPESDARTHIEDDAATNTELSKEFPGLVAAPYFASPSEAKSYIAGLDFFMGARMHACIAAFSSGVPVVPMAYSRKFQGLFGTIGYARTVDCTSETGEAIEGKIRAAYADRAEVKAEMDAACARGLEKLTIYETAMRDTLAKLG